MKCIICFQDITLDEEIKEGLGCFKTKKARLSRGVSYVTIGRAGTGQPYIAYPQLMFSPTSFFALGSPIGRYKVNSLYFMNTFICLYDFDFLLQRTSDTDSQLMCIYTFLFSVNLDPFQQYFHLRKSLQL